MSIRTPDIKRLAVVTPVFPTKTDPDRGIYCYHIARALRDFVDVEVFNLISSYPRSRLWRPRRRTHHHLETDDGAEQHHPGVKAHYINYPALPVLSRPFNSGTGARLLRPYLEEWQPDAILGFWIYPEGYSAVQVAQRMGVPAIVRAMGSDLKQIPDALSRLGASRSLKRASAIICVSEDLKNQAIALGAAANKVHLITNGCDASVFHPADRQAAREQLGVKANASLIVYVGRLEEAKGVRELLQAIESLAATEPEIQLVCIGRGVLEAELRTRIESSNLAKHVKLIGRQSQTVVAQWLAASNVLCLPSYSEGLPNVVLEAFCCGRPVVATTVGGIPELVDESSGILVPPRDGSALATALADALHRRWDENEISRRMGRTWTDVARDILELYRATG